jgi:Fe-S cluster biogenesis protein NfuA
MLSSGQDFKRQARNGKGKGKPTPSPSHAPTKLPTGTPTNVPTGKPTDVPTGTPTNAPTPEDKFSSFVELELETSDGNPDEVAIEAAVELMISTYNEAIESCSDPFARKMVDASVESMSDRRRHLSREGSRELQNLNIFLFLRVSGKCNGCGSDRFFFNQVNRRKLIDDQCEVPPLEDFLSSYNADIDVGDYDSIVSAVSAKDVAKPAGKGKGKSSSKKKSPKAKTSPQGVDTFTSFLAFTLETTDANLEDDDVENAVDLMVSTYNEAIENCDDPFDRKMADAVVDSIADARRQLARQASRGLQNLNILLFLRVSGTCNGCGSNRFFFNQVARRKLFDKNVSADQCVVPETDIFLAAYSASLDSGDFGSIVGAISIEDVAQPSGKGKGGSSTGGSSKGKGMSGESSGSFGMSSSKGSKGGGSGMSSAKGGESNESGRSVMSSAKGASSGVSPKGKSKGMTNKRSHESTSKTSKKSGNR